MEAARVDSAHEKEDFTVNVHEFEEEKKAWATFEKIIEAINSSDARDLKDLSLVLVKNPEFLTVKFFFQPGLREKVKNWLVMSLENAVGSGEMEKASRLKSILEAMGIEQAETVLFMESLHIRLGENLKKWGVGKVVSQIISTIQEIRYGFEYPCISERMGKNSKFVKRFLDKHPEYKADVDGKIKRRARQVLLERKRIGKAGKPETYQSITSAMDRTGETSLPRLATLMGRSGSYLCLLFIGDRKLERRVKEEILKRKSQMEAESVENAFLEIKNAIGSSEGSMTHTQISREMGKDEGFLGRFLHRHPKYREKIGKEIANRKKELLGQGKPGSFDADSIQVAAGRISKPSDCTYAGLSRAFGKEASYANKMVERRPDLKPAVEAALQDMREHLKQKEEEAARDSAKLIKPVESSARNEEGRQVLTERKVFAADLVSVLKAAHQIRVIEDCNFGGLARAMKISMDGLEAIFQRNPRLKEHAEGELDWMRRRLEKKISADGNGIFRRNRPFIGAGGKGIRVAAKPAGEVMKAKL